MPPAALYAVDLVAVSILTFALYFPRHRRRDLVVAYLGVNVGVLAVSAVLSASSTPTAPCTDVRWATRSLRWCGHVATAAGWSPGNATWWSPTPPSWTLP